jgi:acyl-CoA synthetase (AMP-forming)/AMP-acid ligase II
MDQSMSLVFVVDHRADVDPDGDAVSDGSRSLTNDELLHRVRAASRHLRDLGVRRGDVVALRLGNRIEFVVLLFAAWRLGAAVTPINANLTDGEVDRQLDDSGAHLLVTEDTASAHASVTTLAVDALNECLGWPDLPAPPDPDALALLIYTSGTNGCPNGVWEIGVRELEDGLERDECWALANAVYPGFDSYRQFTERLIPVAVLEREVADS